MGLGGGLRSSVRLYEFDRTVYTHSVCVFLFALSDETRLGGDLEEAAALLAAL